MTRKSVLHVKQILDWADAHFECTGRWPEAGAGRIRGTLDEKWRGIDHALRHGSRGLREGSSLARLLAERRGKRNRKALPRLTVKGILLWPKAHLRKHDRWPAAHTGAIEGVPPETWINVDHALRVGARGLRGGSSLSRFLAREGLQRKAGRKIKILSKM